MKKRIIALAVSGACLLSVSSFARTHPSLDSQVMPVSVASPIVLHANLNVPQEVSQTATNTPATAVGVASMLFTPSTDTLQYAISYAGLSSAPFMAHFHFGLPSTNGPILQTICGKPKPTLEGACPDANAGMMHGSWHLSASEAKDLLMGKVYINLHTKLNQNGEIRGQVIPGV